jgi:ribonuclease BN (tRNA processing enzyme)
MILRTQYRNSMSLVVKLLTLLFSLTHAPIAAAQTEWEAGPVTLQVLGSGGPFGNGRASSGYLIWVDGTARVMIDAGGGTFTRFHESGAKVEDLEVLALSHFHPDHSSEVPALLWLRPTDMVVSGPTGSDMYPSVNEYVSGLFGATGVFRAVTNGEGMETVTVDVTKSEEVEVFASESIRVRGLGVPHGIVPAVGYRVDIGDISIAFSSDQNGSDPAFARFAAGVDVLVAHAAIAEAATGFAADLHAKPSVWGQMATDAGVGTLMLSHLTGMAPRNSDGEVPAFDERLANVRTTYDGPLVIAEDLMCVPVGAK